MAVLFLATACNRDPEPTEGVVANHLPLKGALIETSDMPAPTVVLDEPFDSDAGPWNIADPKHVSINGGELRFFRGGSPATANRDLEIDTADVNQVQVRMQSSATVVLAIDWVAREGGDKVRGRVQANIQPSDDWWVEFIDLADVPEWRGELLWMEVRVLVQTAPVRIDSITFTRLSVAHRMALRDGLDGAPYSIDGELRVARPLIAARPLSFDASEVGGEYRLQLGFGVTPEVDSASGGALEVTITAGDFSERHRISRSMGWHDTVTAIPAAGVGPVSISLRAGDDDCLVVSEPRALRPARARLPNILLITADTLRADYLSMYGDSVTVTPHLERLAAEGVVFTDVTSAANVTIPSHSSILTSLYPKDHGVIDNTFRLSSEATTLAEILSDAGYVTCAAIGSSVLVPSVSNIAQGFDSFFETYKHKRSGDEVNERVVPWIEDHADTPWFVWVHFFDPHTPYFPDPDLVASYYGDADPTDPKFGDLPFAANRIPSGSHDVRDVAYFLAQYRAEITGVDNRVGELLDTVDELGLADRSVIAFTADHGEGLGEHNIFFTHEGLYPSTVMVPWIMRAPGAARGARYTGAAETIDIAPTILTSVGLPVPPIMRGTARDLAAGTGPATAVRYFQHSGMSSVGARTSRYHGILSTQNHRVGEDRRLMKEGALELYTLTDANHDVAADRQDAVTRLREGIDAWLKDHLDFKAEQPTLSEAHLQALKQLGY